jgi:hypothetical protein
MEVHCFCQCFAYTPFYPCAAWHKQIWVVSDTAPTPPFIEAPQCAHTGAKLETCWSKKSLDGTSGPYLP